MARFSDRYYLEQMSEEDGEKDTSKGTGQTENLYESGKGVVGGGGTGSSTSRVKFAKLV
jgi:hypothetical protein